MWGVGVTKFLLESKSSYKEIFSYSEKRDSNPQPLRWQRNTLPLSYFRLFSFCFLSYVKRKQGTSISLYKDKYYNFFSISRMGG